MTAELDPEAHGGVYLAAVGFCVPADRVPADCAAGADGAVVDAAAADTAGAVSAAGFVSSVADFCARLVNQLLVAATACLTAWPALMPSVFPESGRTPASAGESSAEVASAARFGVEEAVEEAVDEGDDAAGDVVEDAPLRLADAAEGVPLPWTALEAGSAVLAAGSEPAAGEVPLAVPGLASFLAFDGPACDGPSSPEADLGGGAITPVAGSVAVGSSLSESPRDGGAIVRGVSEDRPASPTPVLLVPLGYVYSCVEVISSRYMALRPGPFSTYQTPVSSGSLSSSG